MPLAILCGRASMLSLSPTGLSMEDRLGESVTGRQRPSVHATASREHHEAALEGKPEEVLSYSPNREGISTTVLCRESHTQCAPDGSLTEQKYVIEYEGGIHTGTCGTFPRDDGPISSAVIKEPIMGTTAIREQIGDNLETPKRAAMANEVSSEKVELQSQLAQCTNSLGQEHRLVTITKDIDQREDEIHISSSETNNRVVSNEPAYHDDEKAGTQVLDDEKVQCVHSSSNSTSGVLGRKPAGLRLNLTGVVQVENTATIEEKDEQPLKMADVIENIRRWLAALDRMEVFSTPDALDILKSIANSHWQHSESREEIALVVSNAKGADILLKILLSLGKEGLFKRNDVWYPANYCYNIVWNLSDGSNELATSLANSGMVGLCAANIAHKPYMDNMHKKNILFLLKASLSILHNISRVQTVKYRFREADLIQKMLPYTSTDQKYLKALCMLILANIVDEEQESLLDEKGTVEFLIELLKEAQASDDGRAQGLSCAELANGLGRLAVNDANKGKIHTANGLPAFINMLESPIQAEQEASTQALWSLSFDPTICKLLSSNQKALDSLRALQSCGSQAVEVSAKGILWMLRQHRKSTEEGSVDGNKKSRPKSSRQSSLRKIHVMISYQWSSQKTVLRIRDDLIAAGYIVWVDVDKMCGSTLQAMAEAVERAAVVIICMSESYKISPNCRTEAEYAYQLQKWIIPLMMDMYYEPDGWLGLILGAKYYMDFSGVVPYEDSSQRLIRELDGSKSSFDAPDSVFNEVEAVITRSTAVTCHSAFGPNNWTEEQVHTWLTDHNLQRYSNAFEDCTGKQLLQLRALRLEAPEFFYRSLREDLGIIGIFNILRFTDALEDIR